MNEACSQLAATGLSVYNVALCATMAIAVLGALVLLIKKKFNYVKAFLFIFVLLFTTSPRNIFAQDSNSCTPFAQVQPPAPTPTDPPITVDPPTEPSDAVITALDDSIMLSSCAAWDTAELGSLNLMNYFTTSGTATLLPNTIDLDPSSPGRQSTVVATGASGSITYAVDSNGFVTMTNPTGTPGWSDLYPFEYTIEDADGVVSSIGTYTVEYLCF